MFFPVIDRRRLESDSGGRIGNGDITTTGSWRGREFRRRRSDPDKSSADFRLLTSLGVRLRC
jgi:hypothetical protein